MTLQVCLMRATLAGIPPAETCRARGAGLEPGCQEVWSLCHLCHQQAVCPWQVASGFSPCSSGWVSKWPSVGRIQAAVGLIDSGQFLKAVCSIPGLGRSPGEVTGNPLQAPWTEEPGGLQSTGSQSAGHNLVTEQQVNGQY